MAKAERKDGAAVRPGRFVVRWVRGRSYGNDFIKVTAGAGEVVPQVGETVYIRGSGGGGSRGRARRGGSGSSGSGAW